MEKSGYSPETPLKTLEMAILERLDRYGKEGRSKAFKYQNLFPNTILDTDVQEKIIAALLSGNHLLLFGPPGSGKTNLIKDILNLLPTQSFAVKDCPVGCSPYSIVDSSFAGKVPPCPMCKSRFSNLEMGELGAFIHEKVNREKIPLTIFHIREGHGFARIQGSPEVFPDNLTGTINLHKLEEIGDPTSPEVIQPGKLLQANRGVLLIDEIGKLPHGTQNVLLQALQEGTVTPAKSRETFPASFIAVTTSNLTDLDAINEPLNDRLSNIYVGYNTEHYKNRMIIDLHLRGTKDDVFLPEIFIEAAVHLVEEWRIKGGDIYEFREVGSNRTMIDIVTRTRSYAKLFGKKYLALDAYINGVRDVMMGRIRARGEESFFENKKVIEDFAKNHTPESVKKAGKKYWCKFYTKELSSNPMLGKKTLQQMEKVMSSSETLSKVIRSKKGYSRFLAFYDYVMKKERYPGPYKGKMLFKRVYDIMRKNDVFSCD